MYYVYINSGFISYFINTCLFSITIYSFYASVFKKY